MADRPKSFDKPIYVTKPILPDLSVVHTGLEQVWESGILSNGGAKHAELERRLSDHLGPGHISLFNNGTIALMVAIKALGLTGEVLVTPFTFAATPHVLSWNGVKPIFVDIDPVTMTIDPVRIEESITPQTTGIIGVHVYGNPCDVVKIDDIARRHGLKVVYDAAHAFGTKFQDKHIGEYGDVTMYSFHATKLFHTAEGGALITSDRALKEKIDLIKNFGIANEVSVKLPGTNGKMNEIQAALGLCVLDLVRQEKINRLKIADVYINRLNSINGIKVPNRPDCDIDSLQYFYIRINSEISGISRDQLYEELKKYNVFARKYFYPLCSNYDCYRSLESSRSSNLPNAVEISEEVLCLPFFGELGVEGAEQISDAIEAILNSASRTQSDLSHFGQRGVASRAM